MLPSFCDLLSFFQSLADCGQLSDLCQALHLPAELAIDASSELTDLCRRAIELAQASHQHVAGVEPTLATLVAMARPEAIAHLLAAARPEELPPDTIRDGPPLAVWFFLHRPELFDAVSRHHECAEAASWHSAQAPPGLALADLDERRRALQAALSEFFRMREGIGRLCRVVAVRLRKTSCFVARIAGRVQSLEVFTEVGRLARRRLRPALSVLFVYCPEDGKVLLQSHLRSRHRIAELFQCFGRAVLLSPVACGHDEFNLEPLKRPFHPLPDAQDMQRVRVKALHLRYPEREGRRLLKLQTLAGDGPSAIREMLRAHVGGQAALDPLRVCYAELQVTICADGKSSTHVLRLWPDRSNLPETPLGARFRSCLRRWGLLHVQP